jgi:hypothetical protein
MTDTNLNGSTTNSTSPDSVPASWAGSNPASGGQSTRLPEIPKLTWWYMRRHSIRKEWRGDIRNLVDEAVRTGEREGSKYSNIELFVATQSAARSQQHLNAATQLAADAASRALQLGNDARAAARQATQQSKMPVLTIHGAVLTVTEAHAVTHALEERIRDDEESGRRRHRRLPASIRASAIGLFVFDTAAWMRLSTKAFNVKLLEPGVDKTPEWVQAIALSLALPLFMFVMARLGGTLLRNRETGSIFPSGAMRKAALVSSVATVTAGSLLTLLSLYYRVHTDIQTSDVHGVGAILISAAIAVGVAFAPVAVLLTHAYDGTPELDELEHVSGLLEASMRDQLELEDESEALRGNRTQVIQQASVAITIQTVAAGIELREGEEKIELARGIHQRTGPYAPLREPAPGSPHGLLTLTPPLDVRGLEALTAALEQALDMREQHDGDDDDGDDH